MTSIECLIGAIFAGPMVAMLLIAGFKVDELVARPQRQIARRRLIPHVDRNGFPVCLDPDGRFCPAVRRG